MKDVIAGAIAFTLLWVIFYVLVCFTWIGAECIIEGFGQISKVDRYVAGLLSGLILHNCLAHSIRKENVE